MGAEIIVPDDFATIQEAVDAATPYDTVFVRDGLYIERVVISKPLTLVGESMEDTIVDGRPDPGYEPGDPVIQIASSNVVVESLAVQGGLDGILVETDVPINNVRILKVLSVGNNAGIVARLGGGSILIENCWIYGNEVVSIHVSNFSQCSVKNNWCGGWDYSVGLRDGRNFELMGNILGAIIYGLDLENCSNGVIKRNELYGGITAIHFWENIMDVTVLENIIQGHDCGISFYLGHEDIKIYHNDFMPSMWNVEPPLADQNNIVWDDGYPSGGNYWWGYAGYDNDGDGIGDIPYVISSDSSDNYPLMKPYQFGIETIVAAKPNKINLKGKGKWLKVFIELPEEYDVRDIDISTIMLNKMISCEPRPYSIGDRDHNGVQELKVRFDRRKFLDSLSLGELHDTLEIKVTGDVNGEQFVGFSYVTLNIGIGKKKVAGL